MSVIDLAPTFLKPIAIRRTSLPVERKRERPSSGRFATFSCRSSNWALSGAERTSHTLGGRSLLAGSIRCFMSKVNSTCVHITFPSFAGLGKSMIKTTFTL